MPLVERVTEKLGGGSIELILATDQMLVDVFEKLLMSLASFKDIRRYRPDRVCQRQQAGLDSLLIIAHIFSVISLESICWEDS